MRATAGWQLPLEEVSALCLSDDGASVVGVGDDRWCFGRAEIGPDGLVPTAPTKVDGRPRKEKGSEFEGVAGDASGRLFVLREGPSLILVLDPEGDVAQTVALRVPDGLAQLAAEWNDPEKANYRGEGILLLRNGHVLVAKQRKSTWLIELGPPGEPARGFTRESAIRAGERFALHATTTEMHALTAWRVDDPEIKSLNDLAVDEHGALYAISSKSRRLARLDHDLDPRGGMAHLAAYDLPGTLFESKADKAEGLVHSRRLGWLVGLDLDREGDNVVLLTGVP